jgi:hypothetical protein
MAPGLVLHMPTHIFIGIVISVIAQGVFKKNSCKAPGD